MLKSFVSWLESWEPEAWQGNARRYPVSDIERGWKLIGKTGLRRRVILAKPDGQLMYLTYENGIIAHKEMMQVNNLYQVEHIVSTLDLVPIDEDKWSTFFNFPQQTQQVKTQQTQQVEPQTADKMQQLRSLQGAIEDLQWSPQANSPEVKQKILTLKQQMNQLMSQR